MHGQCPFVSLGKGIHSRGFVRQKYPCQIWENGQGIGKDRLIRLLFPFIYSTYFNVLAYIKQDDSLWFILTFYATEQGYVQGVFFVLMNLFFE